MRVVGSLTTIPSRINNLTDTLHSITNQSYKLDAIYLNIPYSYANFDTKYTIPDEYNDVCHIVRCQDYGPVTKLIGALGQENDPDTIIITFDDDHVYPEGLVEKLLSRHRQNNGSAIGSAGYKIGKFPFYVSIARNQHQLNNRWYSFDIGATGEPVDIIVSSPGALYLRKFFPPRDRLDKLLRYAEDGLFKHCDLVISGYLDRKGIPRILYKMPHVEGSSQHSSYRSLRPFLKALYTAQQYKLFQTRVEYTCNKTVTYPVIMLTIVIIFFGILFSIRK